MGSGEYTWQVHHAEGPVLDFIRLARKVCNYCVAYCVCYVISEAERDDLLLQVGSDDQAKVYLNGEEVYQHPGVRPLVILDPVGPVTLRKGKNVLVLKVVNQAKDWEGCARFVDREGNPAKGLCISLTPERTEKLSDAAGDQVLLSLKGPSERIVQVVFSPDGARLASAGHEGTVRVWDTASGQVLRTLRGHRGWVRSVTFSPDGTRLASASLDKTIRLWDAASGQVQRTLQGHTEGVHGVVFSPDGARLASASLDKTVKLWDAASGQELRTLRGHSRAVYAVAFSPDGTQLASASHDTTMKLWDAATGKELRTLTGHDRQVYDVMFSPDGTRLASASVDGTVRLWDAARGQMLRTFLGPRGGFRHVAFSPNGARVAAADLDGTMRLWDTASGLEVRTLPGQPGSVNTVAFSPDGMRLASAGWDRTALVWDARPLTALVQAEREALDLVEYLFSQPLPKSYVIQRIQENTAITEEVRSRALAFANRFQEEQDPKVFDQASRKVLRQQQLCSHWYRQAVVEAEAACRLAPKQETYRTTLGLAQYRAGQYAESLTTLAQVEPLHRKALARLAFLVPQFPHALVPLWQAQPHAQALVATLAFRSMAHHQLGQKELAQATLARLRGIAESPQGAQDEETQALLREAEALLQPTAP
jgi:Tol biopolymer transport system component